MTESRLAYLAARAIGRAFDRFERKFSVITDRAPTRFEQRDPAGMQRDSAERLAIYGQIVDEATADIRELLEDRVEDKAIWTGAKAVYSGLITDRDDFELAETFFNSVTRKIFATVGVDRLVEFVASDFVKPPTEPNELVFQTYEQARSSAALVEAILTDFRFRVLYEDIRRDSRLAARRIDAHLEALGISNGYERAAVVRSVFFRGRGAYLVGRLVAQDTTVPLVLALRNTDGGVVVDAVLTDEDAVSVLFSFTRSYFHVATDRPYELVRFLQTLMPRKRLNELYTAIGYHKHGKTELYRDLLDHLATSSDVFTTAPGTKGLVMAVFTMASHEVVFKVMRDVFGAPKHTTRTRVMDRYRLVFRHDRVGRLIDAQEFEHLRFDREHFDEELLEELSEECSRSVTVDGDAVVIRHAYVERRVIPLNLFVREASAQRAARAVSDYGKAIKDLACTNIFPGDLLLKNFGVTRHGRVVFYDYDELAELTECRFLDLPVATHPDDEMAEQPWFGVGELDIFPGEFRSFLGLPAPLREVIETQHGDLFEPAAWREIQRRIAAGEIIEIFPYDEALRLHPAVVPNAGA
jgi:isocitrate dehydrogenase kinase/phosphatase